MLLHFPRCLVGPAANWFDVYDFESYDELKAQFLQRFWGQEIQGRVRRQLYSGKYDPRKNKSLIEYILELSRKAKSLDTPLSNREFISCMSGHFDAETAPMIRPGIITTINGVVEYLMHADMLKRYYKPERKEGSNPSSRIISQKLRKILKTLGAI